LAKDQLFFVSNLSKCREWQIALTRGPLWILKFDNARSDADGWIVLFM